MTTFLLGAAVLVLMSVAAGLAASLRRSSIVDRMMAAQLLGSGTIAALLLVGLSTRLPGTVDLALMLALLAPFAVIGLAAAVPANAKAPQPTDDGADRTAARTPGSGGRA